MITFKTTIEIDRPREHVFAILADPQSYPVWNSAVRAVRPLGDGQRYRMERDLPSGPATNLLEVVAATSPYEVTVRASDGPTPFTYRYRLEEADTRTSLSLEAQVDLEGAAGLLGPIAARTIKHGVDVNLKALKRLLENRPSSPSE